MAAEPRIIPNQITETSFLLRNSLEDWAMCRSSFKLRKFSTAIDLGVARNSFSSS